MTRPTLFLAARERASALLRLAIPGMLTALLLLAACSVVLLPHGVWAAEAAPAAPDPALEKRVNAIAEELRCLVCQNQTLADSHAELAIDLKNQVREKLAQGMSEREIVDYMVARYGDFVLYRPPLKASTLFLWFGPAIILVIGLAALFMRLRRRSGAAMPVSLSADEHARAAALLGEADTTTAGADARPR